MQEARMDTDEESEESRLPMSLGGRRRSVNRPQLSPVDLAAGGNLDKVRDLLFGTQMRDMENHFARLEERLQKDIAELKDETRGRFESLEVFLRKEIESLTDQLKTEQDVRQQAVQTLTQELTETAKAFNQRTNQAEEHIVKAQRELRQHILDQSRSLRDEFWDRYRELSEATEHNVQELRAEKTDRATLAVLLTELAMRLGNEYLLPGNNE
jgi:predicted DNA-binding ribbon-helix-helix protein